MTVKIKAVSLFTSITSLKYHYIYYITVITFFQQAYQNDIDLYFTTFLMWEYAILASQLLSIK